MKNVRSTFIKKKLSPPSVTHLNIEHSNRDQNVQYVQPALPFTEHKVESPRGRSWERWKVHCLFITNEDFLDWLLESCGKDKGIILFSRVGEGDVNSQLRHVLGNGLR